MNTSTTQTKLHRWRKVGIGLQVLGIILGWFSYQAGMSRGIAALSASEKSEDISTGINVALYGIAAGSILAVIGFIVLLAAVIRLHRYNRSSSVAA